MKKMKMLGLGALLVVGAAVAWATGLSGLIISNPGIAYNIRYAFNLSNADVNNITATAVYSSATFSASTFSTGQVSTGSFKVVDNTLLGAAAATNSITVIGSGGFGDSIVIPKLIHPGAFVFLAGRDWNYGATTALTAASINAALNQVEFISHNVVGNVIYTTATVGAFYNNLAMTTNNTGTLTVASAQFTGGRDAASIYVNGYQFQAGRDFTAGGTAALTATAIANAVNAKAGLSAYVTATASSSSDTFQSNGVGTLYNFPLAVSNSAAISVFNSSLVGGANAGYVLGSKNIAIPSHGYTLALPLLYSTGSAAAISGLTNQTTYYAIPVDANTVQLATSSAQAVLGVGTVLASSSTLTAALSYSLTPLAWSAGSAGFDWEVSNDGASWSRVAVSSVTYTDLNHSGAITWVMTPTMLNYQYLSLNVTGPSAGGLSLQVTAQGTYKF